MKKEYVICSLGLSLGVGFGAGCWGFAGSHCGNQNGDQTCADRKSGAFCDACIAEADGCTNELPSNECHFPGFGMESETSSSSSSTSESNTSGSSTTIPSIDGEVTTEEAMPDPSTGSRGTTESEPQCLEHEHCDDEDAPFCANGACVGSCDMADDGACAARHPELPVCDAGKCVQCTNAVPDACGGICDGENNICVACSEHVQCGEAACNFYTGACLSAETIVHVGSSFPVKNLTEAITMISAGMEGTIILHQGIYSDDIVIDDGRVVAFLAHAHDSPIWRDDDKLSMPQLSVGNDPEAGNGTVILDHIRVSHRHEGPAIVVTGPQARVWIDRSSISNRGGGILAQDSGDVTIRNCFVGGDADNDVPANDVNALEVNGASATVLYSTVGAGIENAVALSCSNAMSVVVRNSIIVAQGLSPFLLGSAFGVDCPGAEITYSATEYGYAGMGNVALGEMLVDDPLFEDYEDGDFHLQVDEVMIFENTAQWQTGDPRTDIDGDLRPHPDDATDYVGADVP